MNESHSLQYAILVNVSHPDGSETGSYVGATGITDPYVAFKKAQNFMALCTEDLDGVVIKALAIFGMTPEKSYSPRDIRLMENDVIVCRFVRKMGAGDWCEPKFLNEEFKEACMATS